MSGYVRQTRHKEQMIKNVSDTYNMSGWSVWEFTFVLKPKSQWIHSFFWIISAFLQNVGLCVKWFKLQVIKTTWTFINNQKDKCICLQSFDIYIVVVTYNVRYTDMAVYIIRDAKRFAHETFGTSFSSNEWSVFLVLSDIWYQTPWDFSNQVVKIHSVHETFDISYRRHWWS